MKKTMPNDRQDQPPARHQRHHRQRRAERQRARVAHEDARRMGVVPEEAQRRADDRQAERRQERLVLEKSDDSDRR